jgi:hypothetical protein
MNVRWNLEHSEICFFIQQKASGASLHHVSIMITIFYLANHKLYNLIEKFGIYTAIRYSSELP